VASEQLHIEYLRSGGFAGIDLVAECAGTDLPEDQVRVANDLLAGPSGSALPGVAGDAGEYAASGADRFTYTVRIVRGREVRTFRWSDGTVPEAVTPLLTTLRGLAQPRAAR
jgi:hypothetical protein